MISSVLSNLNENLARIGGNFMGLAQTVYRKDKIMPGIVNELGEIKYAGIDDIVKLTAYHRINSAQTTQLKNGKGDAEGDLQSTFQMSLFVYWDIRRLKLMQDELLLLLYANFLTEIKGFKDIKRLTISIGQANFSSQDIFAVEFRGGEFKIPEYLSVMKLDYSIQIIVNPDCLPACP